MKSNLVSSLKIESIFQVEFERESDFSELTDLRNFRSENHPADESVNWYKERKSLHSSVTNKKLPNAYKSCPKMISLVKLKILTPLQKLPNNVGDLGKLIVAKGFEK